MEKIKTYLIICLLVICSLILQAETVFAAVEDDYPVKIWSADDMEVGNIVGSDGLEFLQPTDEMVAKVDVVKEGRMPFVNAIKTHGSASMLNAYVPKTRAIKFTVTKPCNLRIYAYGASSNGSVNMRVSNADKLIANFTTQYGVLNKFTTYLDSVGTYYIYGNGSLGICEIAIGYINGDADIDFDRDWNDMRILRKVLWDNLNVDEMTLRNIDIDHNGLISANDLAFMTSYMLDDNNGEYEKSQFVSTAVWNANDMSAGYPEIYEGLEFVYLNGDITDRSICVCDRSSSYVSPSGVVKNYVKCIQTDGDVAGGYGNYPVSKAVKFNLEKEAYVTLYLSTGSSKEIQHKAQIMDADGNRVAEFNIDRNIGCYTAKLSGNETYFVYSSTGTLGIYEIDCIQVIPKTINVEVEAGSNYSYILTGENIPDLSNCTYIIKYNNAAITLNSIGENAIAGTSLAIGDNIQIISHENGILKFKYNDAATDWTGVLTVLKFTANSSGTTKVVFEMEV